MSVFDSINSAIDNYIVDSARSAAKDLSRPKGNRIYSDYYYVFTQEELNLFLKFLVEYGGKKSDIQIINVYGDCNDFIVIKLV